MILESALTPAEQKGDWLPLRLGRVLWAVPTSIRKQLEIFQVLMLPAPAGLGLFGPRFPFKYFSKNYLARGLTVAERRSCFLNHYSRLRAAFPARFVRQIFTGNVPLHEICGEGHRFVITIGRDKKYDREGELSLCLEVDNKTVFNLGFSIVPGWVVGSKAADVLLITRLQGTKGTFTRICVATKALHEVAPPALLVAAFCGFARACGIGEMAGICAKNQFAYSEDSSVFFHETYDDFFVELGATKSTPKFFTSPIPLQEKPLELINNGHKSRTRKKRAFKLEIADSVCQRLRESC
jgi:uncharacterized protein VirK/YbjX